MLVHSPLEARRLLWAVLAFVSALSMIILVVTLQLPNVALRNLTGSGVMLLGSMVAAGFLLAGKLRVPAHILCTLFLVSAVAASIGHGVRVPGVVGSFVAVSLAGYLIGLVASIGYASFGLVALWSVFALQMQGRLQVIEPPVQAWGLVLIALLFVTGLILAIPLRGILRAHAALVDERRKLSHSIREHEARSKGLEEEVEWRTQDLAVINADLERFPLALAHDLRTPLQSLSGYASILGQGEKDARRHEALHNLQQAVEAFEARLTLTLEAGRKAHHG
jgi:signal transduction histidine kinase